MLGNKDAVATVAVRNLDAARAFYERTLGLKVVGTEGEELVAFRSGSAALYVYRSQYAGNKKRAPCQARRARAVQKHSSILVRCIYLQQCSRMLTIFQ